MRPWPQVVRDLFPTLGPRHPDRPWYRREGNAWVRIDGVQVIMTDPAGNLRASDDLGERLALADEARPLPHPGLRPGQVWAVVDMTHLEVTSAFQIEAFDRQNALIEGAWTARQDLRDTLVTLRFDEAAFLVHDATCPHFAPWAPTLPPR